MRFRRRGSILLETAMAVALLSLIFLAVAHLLAVAGRLRRETQWHALAIREAANVLERVMARPWGELTADELELLALSRGAARLPESRLRVDVEPSAGPPSTKRIRVQVDWVNLAGRRVQPVELVAWKHRAQTD